MSIRKNTKKTTQRSTTLTIKKGFTYKPSVKRKSHGRTTGLGVMEYWAFLFALNEGLSKPDKMTDDEIVRQMEKEFPKRKTVTARIHQGKIQVGWYRCRYNNGLLTGQNKKKPKQKSYRYNDEGLRIDGQSGRALPKGQQKVQGRPKQ